MVTSRTRKTATARTAKAQSSKAKSSKAKASKARTAKTTTAKAKASAAKPSPPPRRTRGAAPLCTIGYEQATQPALIDALREAGVGLLVDTRAVAASRRPGFSKRQLAAGLDEAGIGYLHLQKLGTPAEGRQAVRSGDVATMWRIYERHLATPAATEQLAELTAIVQSGQRVCLLCYERDVNHCHRRRIAEAVSDRTGARIENLAPRLF